MSATGLSIGAYWDRQYRSRRVPWETGRPSSELRRVLGERRIRPCRALELGCGTGTNAVWMAGRGFRVTAIDASREALRHARRKAVTAGERVRFLAADLTDPAVPLGRYGFFFDRGCYHAVRLADRDGYFRAVLRATRPGSLGLILTGNAAEPEDEVGPPVLEEWQLRHEWSGPFEVIQLRPFRFDRRGPRDQRYLGWSCLVRRRA